MWHFRFRIYWGINYKCFVFRFVSRYIVLVLHRFSLQSARSKCHFKPDTRNSMMETKVPNFVSTMSRTIKCNPCSKLFINQQGLLHTVKLKTRVKNIKLYCIYRCFNTQNYIYPFQNLSLGFILEIFLKFRKFQPRYSYKIYSYKKRVYYRLHIKKKHV